MGSMAVNLGTDAAGHADSSAGVIPDDEGREQLLTGGSRCLCYGQCRRNKMNGRMCRGRRGLPGGGRWPESKSIQQAAVPLTNAAFSGDARSRWPIRVLGFPSGRPRRLAMAVGSGSIEPPRIVPSVSKRILRACSMTSGGRSFHRVSAAYSARRRVAVCPPAVTDGPLCGLLIRMSYPGIIPSP